MKRGLALKRLRRNLFVPLWLVSAVSGAQVEPHGEVPLHEVTPLELPSREVEYRGSTWIAPVVADRYGKSVRVNGLSGIAYLGGNRYAAISDDGGEVILLEIDVESDGTLRNARAVEGLLLTDAMDFEAIAYRGRLTESLLVCEEAGATIREYSLFSGNRVGIYASPPVYSGPGLVEHNRSLESLALRVGSWIPTEQSFWVANEEALAIDGDPSSPDHGALVRISHLRDTGGDLALVAQYAYLTDPMHGSMTLHGGSGLADLVALPDGGTLSLERSFAMSERGFHRTSIFDLDFSNASDVSVYGDLGLRGRSFRVVAKRPLLVGAMPGVGQNVEGLAVGPSLGDGKWLLVGVVDDRDPFSQNRVLIFELRLGESSIATRPDPEVEIVHRDDGRIGVTVGRAPDERAREGVGVMLISGTRRGPILDSQLGHLLVIDTASCLGTEGRVSIAFKPTDDAGESWWNRGPPMASLFGRKVHRQAWFRRTDSSLAWKWIASPRAASDLW